MFDWNVVFALVGFIAAMLTATGSLVWWLSNQFRDMRSLVYKKFDELMNMFSNKLEYHERHDDARFQAITNDLWAIRVRNAARDGDLLETRPAPKA